MPFNNNGGGVYAMLWTEAHIEVFFFPRNAIPADIGAKSPKPDSGAWGQPVARCAVLALAMRTRHLIHS